MIIRGSASWTTGNLQPTPVSDGWITTSAVGAFNGDGYGDVFGDSRIDLGAMGTTFGGTFMRREGLGRPTGDVDGNVAQNVVSTVNVTVVTHAGTDAHLVSIPR